MQFTPTGLAGAWLIELAPHRDDRGFFARTWCRREFTEHGLCTRFVQCNVSFNRQAGTLRGLHYQVPPHEEIKLVRCTRGAVFDVIVDLRSDSPTYLRWTAVELSADNQRSLYIPNGFAHGFQSLVDDTELFYQMSSFFVSEAARGIRWNDPALAIDWPLNVTAISQRDNDYASLAA